jgi:hypothetical protein
MKRQTIILGAIAASGWIAAGFAGAPPALGQAGEVRAGGPFAVSSAGGVAWVIDVTTGALYGCRFPSPGPDLPDVNGCRYAGRPE